MLRVIAAESVKAAQSYYMGGLKVEGIDQSRGEYYGAEQEMIGNWGGEGLLNWD
ncbi:MAG: hypothetical protein HC888_10830 [Candidatus Competibacteraceae bacterium]|nr:hypothetical protein [Candidatus Competibacteraceae bacterium]